MTGERRRNKLETDGHAALQRSVGQGQMPKALSWTARHLTFLDPTSVFGVLGGEFLQIANFDRSSWQVSSRPWADANREEWSYKILQVRALQ